VNLDRIKHFIAVAETSSFTKASERLFITQPSLSVSIHKLEEELGVKLFERAKKRVLLTNVGKHFLDKAQIIIDEYETTKYELRKRLNNQRLLKLGVIDTMAVAPFNKSISRFFKTYPDIEIEQFNGDILELKSWLEKGNIDLIIGVLGNKEDSRESRVLYSESYSLVVAEGHPLASQHSVSLAEVSLYPYIDRIRCEMRNNLQRLLSARKICPNTICRSSHDEWTKSLIAEGNSVAVMPQYNSFPGLVNLPFSDLKLARKVGLIWRFEQEKSNSVNLFCDYLEEAGLFHSKDAL
jgi:DNA-binding transcriptional LysR family regulator